MAAIPITIVGTLTGKSTKEGEASATEQVMIVGIASLTDLQVGGGPMAPGQPTHPIYYPPGIWGGGNVPMPTPPISGIPGLPGYEPPPDISQPPPEGAKPPPAGGGWGYHPDYGWGYFPAGGKPQPGK
jgi:hypothetical protein